ncbi:glycerophosphodiester phosphodiesterase [Chelativorans xinjiangense]|uniref:glycerophosphodiester phosphodiesterase n=1 Tax=Chelativorans xinjiangense TaxID=2681485 RepID=UPI0013582059|nr:glycerophosphodiester phosphodiesterase [Chelativorans xinjiangense]
MKRPLFPFLEHPRPIPIAHRGGAQEAEENTWAAFERAIMLGYRHIETDIQASRDDVAVIFHDDTLERLTGRPEPVGALAWSDLEHMSTLGGGRLAKLEDVLSVWPDCYFNLEPKSDAAVSPIAEAVARCNALDRVCVGSVDQRRVKRLREMLGPDLCWSPAHFGVTRLWLAGWGFHIGRLSFPVVQVPRTYGPLEVVTPRFVEAAHALGIDVHVWTVDAEEEMDEVADFGVDGVMTDRPSLLKEVLQRRGQWTGA